VGRLGPQRLLSGDLQGKQSFSLSASSLTKLSTWCPSEVYSGTSATGF
jgi:hypothetical protein